MKSNNFQDAIRRRENSAFNFLMGFASETSIEEFNCRYATDEDFRRDYDASMEFEAWQEAEFFEREKELERSEEFFDDKLIDVRGLPIELPEDEPVIIDEDIPF